MWEMLLRMTGVTLLYVAITAGLWLCFRKKAPYSLWFRILFGLVFGGISVLANHFGIDYGYMLLNVRDIGPLAAGLFFSPLSGVLAGLIGGVERFIAGEVWKIGSFTTMACSVSTVLAGLLGAFMHWKIYKGKRPPVLHAFLLGVLTEVFHMYAVLIFRRDALFLAYQVVSTVAIPMIAFTSAGLMLCSMSLRLLAHESPDFGWNLDNAKVTLPVQIQRLLLMVTALLFLVNFGVTWSFRTRLARVNTVEDMEAFWQVSSFCYGNEKNTDRVRQYLDDQLNTPYYFVLLEETEANLHTGVSAPVPLNVKDHHRIRERMASNEKEAVFTMPMETYQGDEAMCLLRPFDNQCALMIFRPTSSVFEERNQEMLENTLSDILLFAGLYVLILILVEHLVIRNLKRVNISLNRITEGHLEEEVRVRASSEFSELSDDINKTVSALRGYISAAERKMEDELRLAASIQDSALPRNFNIPSEHVELYASMHPARQVGGDFYDFFSVAGTSMCLVIADVSGKGVPASLFMMRAKTSIKYYARTGVSPAEILASVNETLCEDNDADMFVTVWLGILDLDTGLMKCCNAGHEYPAVMRSSGEYELLEDKHGMVLATFPGIAMTEYEIQLNPGDRMFVYTDGVPEAQNEEHEFYGTKRMTEKLNDLRRLDQKSLLEQMLLDIRSFSGSADQSDDITMMGFTYK